MVELEIVYNEDFNDFCFSWWYIYIYILKLLMEFPQVYVQGLQTIVTVILEGETLIKVTGDNNTERWKVY